TGTPRFIPVTDFSLVDEFEPLTVDVIKPRHLCTPANKNGEGIADPATHLKDYQLKPVIGSPKHVPQTNLRIVNQLGTVTLNTVKPATLLVPAAEDPAADLPAPSFASHQ